MSTPGSTADTSIDKVQLRTISVQRIISDKVALTIDQAGRIDALALAAKGILIAPQDCVDPRLIGRARAQEGRALKIIKGFVAENLGFIEKRGERLALSGKAMAVMFELVRDHDCDAMQRILGHARERALGRFVDLKPAPSESEVPTRTHEPKSVSVAAATNVIAGANAAVDEANGKGVAATGKAAPITDQHPALVVPVLKVSPPKTFTSLRRPPPGWGDGGIG